MLHGVLDAIREAVAGLSPPVQVAILSALPISEVRGGIPWGMHLGMTLWQILPIAIVSNVLSVVPVILWFNPVADWLSERGYLVWLVNKLLARARAKKPMVDKYGIYALTFFVAVPLPMTGAWTGSLVAAVFKMDFWRALLCMLLGVVIASIIVTLISLGGFHAANSIAGG